MVVLAAARCDLRHSAARVQLVLVSSRRHRRPTLVYGPASDRFGRRPVLIVGLATFLLGTAPGPPGRCRKSPGGIAGAGACAGVY
jgi:MFS family permease